VEDRQEQLIAGHDQPDERSEHEPDDRSGDRDARLAAG
jgi:hypothetical protein